MARRSTHRAPAPRFGTGRVALLGVVVGLVLIGALAAVSAIPRHMPASPSVRTVTKTVPVPVPAPTVTVSYLIVVTATPGVDGF